VRAYALLAERGAKGETYNVGTGVARSIESILQRIIRIVGVDIEVRVDESRFRPIDVPLSVPDTTKLRAATGWEPTIPLERTLRDILERIERP